jgi:hypothetical protein
VAASCEYGDETSRSIKRGEFFESLRIRQLLRKASAPWSKQWKLSAKEEKYERLGNKIGPNLLKGGIPRIK